VKSFKPYILAIAATLLAAGSYCIAWVNMQDLKDLRALPIAETVVVSGIYASAPVVVDAVPVTLAMSQREVSATIEAVGLLTSTPAQKHWQKNSKAEALKPGKSYIAIVIDDVGVVADRSKRSIEELPKEVTLSFLPYGDATAELAKQAYDLGHEVMIHLPMQPKLSADGYVVDPGEGALYTNLEISEIAPLTALNFKGLSSIAVGVNNHMGSKFTEWAAGLSEVFKVVEKHELMFLDSVTTANSAAESTVRQYDIPFLKRNVFLDHVIETDKILQALHKTERVAKSTGYAIAIGHPHDETTEAIKLWAKGLEAKNIQLVPITALIKGK
jgi:polysaccharide deacetylase 2 family uncharacterized protein YibQ